MKALKIKKGAKAKVGKVGFKKPRAAAGKGAGSVGHSESWDHHPLTGWPHQWYEHHPGQVASKHANPLGRLNRKLNK